MASEDRKLTAPPIRTVAVLGAGTMGHGIAQVAAATGHATRLFDIEPGLVERGLGRVRANLDKGVERGKVTAPQRDATLAACETAVADAGQDGALPDSAAVEPVPVENASAQSEQATPVPPADVAGMQADAESEPGRLAMQKQRVERLMKRAVDVLPDADSIKSLAAKPVHFVTDTYAWVVKKL